jgi:rhamnose utilization protein RhaD (predicted bifunctional aldolase and dehydrogenase)
VTRPSSQTELADLARVSARLGADPALVQGPGGNTSLKLGDRLWVKASGLWLEAALKEPIFTPVSLACVRQMLADGTESFGEAVIEGLAPDGLKPSIETALHALMSHRAVIHAHAVNAVTASVLSDGEVLARDRLGDIGWAWVPYRRPGLPLAQAVAAALRPGVDVLILQNHGVVVGGETPDVALRLLEEVERRLAFAVRTPAPDLARLRSLETGAYEVHGPASAIAIDPIALAAATKAALFPDQATFLRGPMTALDAGVSLDGAVAPLLLIPGLGALARRDRSRNAESQILGLASVLLRLPAGHAVHGLSEADVAALLGWEGEHHRQGLDRPFSAAV